VYEVGCYLVVGALAATAALRRARWTVVVLGSAAYMVMLNDLDDAPSLLSRPIDHGAIGPLSLVGGIGVEHAVNLGFVFLMGAAAWLYRDRLPMHGGIAAIATGALALSLARGPFLVVGLPAFAYLVLYAVVALPRALHTIGRSRDYSYGVYIYAFPVQQVIAVQGGAGYGVAVFIALSAAGTLALAALSWHLIERPALRLKDWTPTRRAWSPCDAAAVVQATDARDGTR
jgi:peptidoglycan/LPS O-acetylase OafA/YrhL